MPFTVDWFDANHTVILITLTGKWENEDFHTANQLAKEVMITVNHAVDVIVDLQKGNRLPPNFLTSLSHIRGTRAPNMRGLALVGANRFVEMLSNTFTKVYRPRGASLRLRFMMAPTVEDALKRLGHSDQVSEKMPPE